MLTGHKYFQDCRVLGPV